MNQEVETEAYYDILSNAEGELLFCLKARNASPDKPQILFSGENHALFYRTAEQTIILDYIHPDVIPLLKEVDNVLVAEFSEATPDAPERGIVREYHATVRHVSKLPLSTNP